MSDFRNADPPTEPHSLSEFFAMNERPAEGESRFSPQDVAVLIRQDRDGSD